MVTEDSPSVTRLILPSPARAALSRPAISRPTYGISGRCRVHAAGPDLARDGCLHRGQTQILDYGQFRVFIKLEAYGIKLRNESLPPHMKD